MNHLYSTLALVILLIVFTTVSLIFAFSSNDLDKVCNQVNNSLLRNNNKWECFPLTDYLNNYLTGYLIQFNISNPFDQSLNTTDDVIFNSVSASNICYSDGSNCVSSSLVNTTDIYVQTIHPYDYNFPDDYPIFWDKATSQWKTSIMSIDDLSVASIVASSYMKTSGSILDSSNKKSIDIGGRKLIRADGTTTICDWSYSNDLDCSLSDIYSNSITANNVCLTGGGCLLSSYGDFYFTNFTASFRLNNSFYNWNKTQTYNKTEIDNNFSKYVPNNISSVINSNLTINGTSRISFGNEKYIDMYWDNTWLGNVFATNSSTGYPYIFRPYNNVFSGIYATSTGNSGGGFFTAINNMANIGGGFTYNYYTSNNLEFYAGGFSQNKIGFVLNSVTNNFGLGLSSPQAKLHVNGSAIISGNLSVNYINATNITSNNYFVGSLKGISQNITIMKTAVTTCDLNFTGGILYSTTC